MPQPSALDATVLVAQLVSTWAMVGLIWFVQIVHYPLFAAVGADDSVPYAVEHQRRTSYVVGPPMAVEGVTALWLVADPPAGIGRAWPFVALVLLGVVHASTVLLQVPQHAVLARSHEPERIRRLVRSNWVRTVGWTARGAIVAGITVAALRR